MADILFWLYLSNSVGRYYIFDDLIIEEPTDEPDRIPLYSSMENDIRLTHLRMTAFDFGFVQTTYLVKKNA